MGLLSIFQRKSGPGVRSAVPQDAAVIAAERARARRRLVGAVVLVLAGVIGFPLLFDTAPRPLPVDMPIEIPGRESAPPLQPASAARVLKADAAASESQSVAASRAAAPVIEPASAAEPEKPPEPREPTVAAPADKKTEAPAERSAEAKQAEAARAQAALEGRPLAAVKPDAAKAADAAGRFVVQVGAFSEADSAREARARVEKLGLKTYTQTVDTAAGKRIRVRLGPYADRAEAEKVAARLKQAGITSAVRAP